MCVCVCVFVCVFVCVTNLLLLLLLRDDVEEFVDELLKTKIALNTPLLRLTPSTTRLDSIKKSTFKK